MRRNSVVAVAAILMGFFPTFSQADTCQTVSLEPSFRAGDLKGMAPANGISCFHLRVPRGQNMSIEVISGRNVSVSVPDYYDARSDRMYIGDLPGQVEIRVFQLMRAASPEPFVVRVRFEAPGNG